MFEFTNKGIKITGIPLWLDPLKKVPMGFISHAHGDHIRKHEKIIATPPTISLVRHRYGEIEAIPLNFNVPYAIGDVVIELFPAGHILGSAQILIRSNDTRLVYTGDFNPRGSSTAERMEIRETDILIMESTFGLPQFRFPQRWQVIEKLVQFIEKCFSKGFVPVVLSYSLGKSQEVMKILGDLNYQLIVYPGIHPISKIYEEHGVVLKNWKKYEGESLREKVVIMPPYLRKWIEKIYKGGIKKVIVTGWAADPDIRYRYGADEAIPMSDHADFDDLLNYVKQASPKVIYITHGFEQFVHYLRKEGFTAHPLIQTSQISLF